MCGVVGALVCMLCRNCCSAGAVASQLTFFPPHPPFYKVQDKDGQLEIIIDESLPPKPYENMEVTYVTTRRRKRVLVVLYKCPGAKYTILYSHGNATDCGSMHEMFVDLVIRLGVNVVGYDFTGYGASENCLPSEQDTYADIEAVYHWTLEHAPGEVRTGVPGIILYGQSVGSGPTCHLAVTEQCAGAVLHSPILSGMRVLTESRALGCLDIYPNVDRIPQIRCPVTVVHGKQDQEVSWEHGRRLHALVPANLQREPWWVPDRGHNDIVRGRTRVADYYKHLAGFIDSLDPANGTHTAALNAAMSSALSTGTHHSAGSQNSVSTVAGQLGNAMGSINSIGTSSARSAKSSSARSSRTVSRPEAPPAVHTMDREGTSSTSAHRRISSASTSAVQSTDREGTTGTSSTTSGHRRNSSSNHRKPSGVSDSTHVGAVEGSGSTHGKKDTVAAAEAQDVGIVAPGVAVS